uniref:N-acetyltransferase domain-containing protein n=1 Tax=Panagrolaimus davidi TaxID=227884 RepID=A0A914PRB7_9BILA
MFSRCVLHFRPIFFSQNALRLSSTSSSLKPIQKREIKKHYPVPPRLRYVNGYLKDFRDDRRILSILNFKDKYDVERKLQIELLDENDIGLVGQYFTDVFMNNCSMIKALGEFADGTYEEMAPFFYDDLASKLPNKMSMIVKDDDKVVGYHIMDKIERDNFDKYFTNGSHMDKPYLDFKDNYAEDIKNGPFESIKANRLAAAINAPLSQTLRFVPKHINCILYFEAVGIDKHYQNAGLFPELVRLMHKIAYEHGCEYGVVYSVAAESARISLVCFFQLIIHFYY